VARGGDRGEGFAQAAQPAPGIVQFQLQLQQFSELQITSATAW
jgi:hypothetical protein